jgi:hypothetical protein
MSHWIVGARRRRTIGLAAAASLAVAAALAANIATAHVGQPRVVTCRGVPMYKPSHDVVTCGGGFAEWTGVKWTTWAHTAVGHGEFGIKYCTASCAHARLHVYPAVVHLVRYMHGTGGMVYCGAVIDYVAGKHEHTYTASLPT